MKNFLLCILIWLVVVLAPLVFHVLTGGELLPRLYLGWPIAVTIIMCMCNVIWDLD